MSKNNVKKYTTKNNPSKIHEFDKDKTVVLYAENNDESMNASMLLFDEDFKLVYFFLNEYSSWKNDININ